MAIVYNGDEFDGGADGYGDRPPALGFQMVGGPIVPPDGLDNDHDGTVDEVGERLGMTRFVYYNSDATVQGNPRAGDDAYRYLQGLWRDDVPITRGGSGRGFSEIPVTHMFPDNPPAFWSEENIDGAGSRNTPADRNFIASTGPFILEPGATETVTYAIVFSQGRDRLDSYELLEKDARYVQNAFDAGFQPPASPDAPVVQATSLDGKIILKWGNESKSNNYLDGYSSADPFLRKSGASDSVYTLEGYNVYRFQSESDAVGERIAVFDRVNGVQRVFDSIEVDPQTATAITVVVADGVDSGIQHSLVIEDVTNYKTYYFGVDAYAYNAESSPKVLKSVVTRVAVEPSRSLARGGGTVVVDSALGSELTVANGRIGKDGIGSGMLEAMVVDPLAVTGHTYRVEFFESNVTERMFREKQKTSYLVVDEATGLLAFDGTAAEVALGHPTPLGENVVQFDGISVSLSAPEPGPLDLDGTEAWAFIQVEVATG